MIWMHATASRSSAEAWSPAAIEALNFSKSESNHCLCEASIQWLSMMPRSTCGLPLLVLAVSSQSSSSMTRAPSVPLQGVDDLAHPGGPGEEAVGVAVRE